MPFRRRLFGSAVLAVAIGVGVALPPPTLASHTVGGVGWIRRDDSGYRYHIPVCLHPNYGGPTWDLTQNYHAAANYAITTWNGVGGELYFYRTNTSCQSLYNNGVPYVQIGYSNNIGDETVLGDTIPYTTGCSPAEVWGFECVGRAAVWLNYKVVYYYASGTCPSYAYDARSILLHELGHTLILVDTYASADQDLVMYGGFDGGEMRRTLRQDDRDGYAWYYGTTH